MITYHLDSRFFILEIAGRAIGLAFITYDHISQLVYGNYIAVQECWRASDLAGKFAERIEDVLKELFPEYRETVFEVQNK